MGGVVRVVMVKVKLMGEVSGGSGGEGVQVKEVAWESSCGGGESEGDGDE